jgi:hypothetical protein
VSTPDEGRRRWLRTQLGKKQVTHGVYAEIVLLAVILALEGKRDDSDIVSTIVGSLLALFLAEAYADYIGTMIGTGKRPTWAELRSQLASTAGSFVVVIPPIVLVALGVAGAIGLHTGFLAAKLTGIAVIGTYAVVANRRAGLPLVKSLVGAVFLIAIATGLVLLKHWVH